MRKTDRHEMDNKMLTHTLGTLSFSYTVAPLINLYEKSVFSNIIQ